MGFGLGFGIALKPSGTVVFLVRVGEVGDCGLLALVGPILYCEGGWREILRSRTGK